MCSMYLHVYIMVIYHACILFITLCVLVQTHVCVCMHASNLTMFPPMYCRAVSTQMSMIWKLYPIQRWKNFIVFSFSIYGDLGSPVFVKHKVALKHKVTLKRWLTLS